MSEGARGGLLARFPNWLLVFVTIAALGPPVGAMGLAVPGLLSSIGSAAYSDKSLLVAIGDVLSIVLGLIFFAYLFGGVPAIVSGLFLAVWVVLGRRVTYLISLAVGAFSGFAFVAGLELAEPSRDMSRFLGPALMLAAFGAFASVPVTFLLKRWRLV